MSAARAVRARALLSLALFGILAVYLGGLLATNAGSVLLALLSFVLAASGSWWVVAKRGTASVLGSVAVLLGAVGFVTAIVLAGGSVVTFIWRSAVAAVLLALAVATARSAMLRLARESRPGPTRKAPPHDAVLICNRRSGGGKVERFELVELARQLGVRTVTLEPGSDLAALAAQAMDDGTDCIGMAGGDGSQALVAGLASERGIPFVCVPAGTRNHFALDLGLDRDDPRAALSAFRDGVERTVDLATVNGRTFVNNVSLGVYAMVVQREEYRDAKRETTRRVLPEVLSSPRDSFSLRFETPTGTGVDDAVLILVSNNPYVLRASQDAATRRRLDAGTLGVCSVSAASGPQAAAVLLEALAGRRRPGGRVMQFEVEHFEVTSAEGTVPGGVDGEAVMLPSPLKFDSMPGALRLLVPEGNPEIAARRAAHEWTLGGLARIMAGSTLESTA